MDGGSAGVASRATEREHLFVDGAALLFRYWRKRVQHRISQHTATNACYQRAQAKRVVEKLEEVVVLGLMVVVLSRPRHKTMELGKVVVIKANRLCSSRDHRAKAQRLSRA